MINVKHLKKKYTRGKEVITDLSLSFGETGLNIVCGKSGCGKTTLINILGGMDLEYEGEVTVDGLDLNHCTYTEIADYRNFTSAFVFQKNSLFEFLTVEENLKLCLDIQNNDSNISEALERVGLKGFEKKKVRALSGGEKQRVAIARALIKDCKIIFADEPTSALDSKNAHKIFQLFKELSKDKLVIIVTHDMKKATMYADRVIRLIDGNIEEDIVYNERCEKARELKEKKSKPFSMMPIFKHNLKKGMVINLFVIVLLIAAMVITNLAIEQAKVKEEYDNFGANIEGEFNYDRAIYTQVLNGVNLYDVVKSGNADNPYYYLEHAINVNTSLSEGDYNLISANLGKYELYNGTTDSNYSKVIIEGVSNKKRLSEVGNDGVTRVWYTYEFSNFEHYEYNENYNYNLVAGRLPENENEILVTDTVADMYLRKRAYDPGTDYEPYYNDYVVDYNELLSEYYTVHYTKAAANKYGVSVDEEIKVKNEMIIFDTYGTYQGSVGGEATYYMYDKQAYKVVGIIETGILPYYTYNYDSARYYLLENFETQSGAEDFMNSLKYQPNGYVVIPNGLKSTNKNINLEVPYKTEKIKVNGMEVNSYYSAFTGQSDYTENGLAGYIDDLEINKSGRLLVKSVNRKYLADDEVIITVDLARKLYPELGISNGNAERKFDDINGDVIDVEFETAHGFITKTLRIVGIAKNFAGYMYLSDNVVREIYVHNKGGMPALTINLEGYGVKSRKKVMEELYNMGYALVPRDIMPGAYLEFVEGKGEMIAEVDYDGLASLFPNYEVRNIDGVNYFYVDELNYGNIIGDYVYMSSSIVRQIALDDSYYTSQGNLSPYYIFSDYYNSSINGCITNSDQGNSLLEIVDSLYQFFLGVALILSIGFIYLKEYRQKESVTKLSMLGVRTKDLVTLNLLTYIPMAIIIGVLSLGLSKVFVDVINDMYSYSFVNQMINDKTGMPIYDLSGNVILVETIVHRVRLMFTNTSYLSTILITLGVLAVTLASSIFVTLRSRK